MAGHEKVYGICENKCMVEVYPKTDVYKKDEVYTKDEVYSKDEVYTKDEVYSPNDFIVVRGSVMVEGNSTKVITKEYSAIGIDDDTNVFVISAMQTIPNESKILGTQFNVNSSDTTKVVPHVELKHSGSLTIEIANPNSGAGTIVYKVLLMRV